MPHGNCYYCKNARPQLVFGPVDQINGVYVYACDTHRKDKGAKIDRTDSREAVKAANKVKLTQDKWYKEQLKQAPKKCENCGKKIIIPGALSEKTKVCHILSKSKFPSVATHPENRWFGCWPCHQVFDSTQDKAQHLPIAPTCIERMKSIYPELTEGEKGKVPGWLVPGEVKEGKL